MALVSDILLRVTGTSDDARRALREVAAEVAAFNAIDAEAKIQADPKQALAKIAEVDAALHLIGQRKVSATVKVDIDQARTRLRLLKRELDHALSGGAGARPVARIASDIAAISGEVAQMGAELGTLGAKAGGAVAQIGSAIGSGLSTILTSVAGGLITIVSSAALVAVAAAVLVPIIVALAGAFLLLVSSLAAAVAGFAALLTSGIFVALPAIAVAVFAIVRLVGAVKALRDEEKNRATAAAQLHDAERAHTQAIQAKQDAVENLAQAQTDALKAERDAILGVRDAQLQLAESKLGIQDASIALAEAKLRLEELKGGAKGAFGGLVQKATNINSGTPREQVESLVKQVGAAPGGTQGELDLKKAILDVAHAQLRVKEAKQSEIHATNSLADANERNNEFVREGIKAYRPYTAALRQVASAEEALAESTKNISDVRAKAHEATKKYSETELSVGQQIIKVMDSLKKALQPAAEPVGKGAIAFFEGLDDLLSNASIQDGLKSVGEAIGAVFSSLGDLVSSTEVQDTLGELADASARLVRSIGTGAFQDLLVILLRIARVAAPALEDLFDDFNRFTGRIRRSTSDTDKLRGGVNSVVRSFRAWLELGHQLARVIIALFVGGKEKGDSLVRTITRALRRFADFLNTKEGRQQLLDFFDKSIEKTKGFLGFLRDVYNVFAKMVEIVNLLAKAIGGLANAIEHTAIGGIIKGVAGAIGQVAGGGSVADAAKALLHPGGDPDDDGSIDQDLLDEVNRKRKKKGLKPLKHFAGGGLVPGPGGRGDDQVAALEGGEFVLKRSVVRGIGLPTLNALNNGSGLRAANNGRKGGGDIIIEKQDVILPAAPGHDQMGDARSQAQEFGRELKRRGRGGR